MLLNDGVTIENAIFDTPGYGIYCLGSCTLKNIYYKRLCYHAVGFAYQDKNKSYTYKVIGGAGQGSPDKYFTQSGKGTTIIQNFCGEGKYGKLWCSCGNCPFQTKRSVQIYNTVMKGPGLSVVSVNSNYGDNMLFSGLTLHGQNSPSTATKYACQNYNAFTYVAQLSTAGSFKPTESGTRSAHTKLRPLKLRVERWLQQNEIRTKFSLTNRPKPRNLFSKIMYFYFLICLLIQK